MEEKKHVLGFFTAIETKYRYQTILKTIKIGGIQNEK
jgi:hypothetical protein